MEGKAYEFLMPVIHPDKKVFNTENIYIGEPKQKDIQYFIFKLT
jgi:hypothetical protein